MDPVRDPAPGAGNRLALKSRARHKDLQRHVIAFGRELRSRELLSTSTEIVDALRVMNEVDLADRRDVYLGTRAVFMSKPEDQPVFDEVFNNFWRRIATIDETDEATDDDEMTSQGEDATDLQEGGEGQQQLRLTSAEGDGGEGDEDGDEEALPLYSPVEMLANKDFSRFQAEEMTEIARAVLIIAKRLATKESRRFRVSRKGTVIDARRTMRRNMKYGGTILELARKKKKIRKPRLVVICDVSRSMDTYSRFLLQFIHAMQNTIGKVESFVFSTSLTRVTEYFKNDDIIDALDRIAREVHDWSGGTRIGQSLTTFNEVWGKKLLNRHTIVVILSDGLDTGDAEILRKAMEDLQEMSGKVVWLNPLLGSKDYRPLARGMSTALEHVDVFAPAHNLASLEALSKFLTA
ncbi:MAG: VWA domain-containing protein [Chloroflexi bacterium]|nr:VWA domain-containing protein [Chloroflexota bacterium]